MSKVKTTDPADDKSHIKRNLIILILIAVALPILFVLVPLISFGIGATNANNESNQVYRGVIEELPKLKLPQYHLLTHNISTQTSEFIYYTNVKLVYQNLSNRTPPEVQKDVEKAFTNAGCMSDPTKDSYASQYNFQQIISSGQNNSLFSQRNMFLGVSAKDIIDPENNIGLPYMCNSPTIRYYFGPSIDSQADYNGTSSENDYDENYYNGDAEVPGVDYQTIDFAKQPVDKFIISGSYSY